MILQPPRPLLPGGHIGVAAISSSARRESTEASVRALENRGFRVTLASNAFAQERTYLAGPDSERVDQFNALLRDGSIDAIFFTRGGYGAMRILDRIDYEAFRNNPRAVVGYSDVTALHMALARETGFGSFHGPMLDFDLFEGLSDPVERWLWKMLAGASPMKLDFEREAVLADGQAEGTLFGGCLSLIVAMSGTPWDFWIDDGILFFEDVGEDLYRIDRMLTHLRLSGRLRSLRAVLIGRLKNCGSDERAAHSLLREFFIPMGIPVVCDLPFGHHGNNVVMPFGARVTVDTESCSIVFPDPATAIPEAR